AGQRTRNRRLAPALLLGRGRQRPDARAVRLADSLVSRNRSDRIRLCAAGPERLESRAAFPGCVGPRAVRRALRHLGRVERPFPQKPSAGCEPSIGAAVFPRRPAAPPIRAAGRGGRVVVQPHSAADLPRRDLRAVPARHLDGPGDVARVRVGRAVHGHDPRRPAVGAHAAFSGVGIAGGVPADSRRDGLVRRIRDSRHGDDYRRTRADERAGMSAMSRRTLITRGLTAAAGLSGLAVAERIADRYGLIPPDHGGLYGPGETLTYAAQRLLTRHSLAREFSRSQISP